MCVDLYFFNLQYIIVLYVINALICSKTSKPLHLLCHSAQVWGLNPGCYACKARLATCWPQFVTVGGQSPVTMEHGSESSMS